MSGFNKVLLLLLVLVVLLAASPGATADTIDTYAVVDDPHPMTPAPGLTNITATPGADTVRVGCDDG